MKRAGKAHWLMIAGLASVLVLLGLVIFGRDSAGETAAEFMTALGSGNAEKLTDLTFLGTGTKEEMRAKWEFATKRAAPYYRFTWRITNVAESGPNDANVTLQVMRNASASSYEEKFQLPLVKVKDEWKVDVRSVSSQMYPGLPR